MHKWTKAEEKILKLKRPVTELAKLLGRKRHTVECKMRNSGIPIIAPPRTRVEDDVKQADGEFWKKQHDQLTRKYAKLLDENTVTDRLVAHIKDLAPIRYSPLPPVVKVRAAKGQHAQSAVLQFSDTHIGKNVQPSQTLQFGQYNFATFMARLKFLEQSVISIINDHTTSPVDELVVAMLGDMLDGTLVHSNEASQLDTIFTQFYAGAHVGAQFLRNIAAHVPKVRIYTACGNHTRFSHQRKMPSHNRFSNFDQFFYALTRELLRDVKNIGWDLSAQPYAVFDVKGFAMFGAHGDTVRGGDKALGVPNHAIGRLVSTATQLMNKYNRPAPNYYLLGHLHREISLPHATGSVLVNGGFPGVDGFGLSEMFTPADPSQNLFFVHPRYAKTAAYTISLKFAEVTDKAPYTVPAEFPAT